jgi:hypothetical protein
MTIKGFGKFCLRHWKFVAGVIAVWAGMSLATQGEYETGKKDAADAIGEAIKDFNDFLDAGGKADDYHESDIVTSIERWNKKTYG